MTKDPLSEMRAKLLQAATAGIACGYSRCAAKLDLESVEVLGDANAIIDQMVKAGKLESLDASLTRDPMADGLRIAEAVCREMDMRALAYGRTGDAKDVIDLPTIVAKVLGEPVPKSESVEALQLRVAAAEKALNDLEEALIKREMTFCIRGNDLWDLGFVEQGDRNKERQRAEQAENALAGLIVKMGECLPESGYTPEMTLTSIANTHNRRLAARILRKEAALTVITEPAVVPDTNTWMEGRRDQAAAIAKRLLLIADAYESGEMELPT